LREPAGENGVIEISAAREDSGDSGADRAFADFQFSIAGNQRGVTDENAGNVGDGIERAGSAVKRNSEVARPRFRFLLCVAKKRNRE